MRRIITYGKYNKVICTECDCEFTFDTIDVVDGKVMCPCCNEENTAPVKPSEE